MSKTVQVPAQQRAAEIRAASFDEAANTIDVVFTTGAAVRRRSWADGPFDEVLVVEPGSVRLGRLNAGAPFLNTHDDWSLRSVLGSVVPGSARIENGQGLATILLSRRPEVAGIMQDIRDGVIRNISVGYRYHEVVKIEGQDGSPAVWRVTDWEPLEISAVPVPADPGSQIRATDREQGTTHACILRDAGGDTADRAGTANPKGDQSMPDKQNSAADEARGDNTHTQVNPPAPQAPDVDAIRAAAAAEAVRAERDRADGIRSLAAKHRKDAFGHQHITAGTSLVEFRGLLLDHLADEQEDLNPQAPTNLGRAKVGRDETETRRNAAIEYMTVRGITGAVLSEPARQFRGMRLIPLASEVMSWSGISVRGLTDDEIAVRALSTSDFPLLLSAVANKVLRAGYEAAPQTFKPFTRGMTLSDFKAASIMRRGLTPGLAKLNEKGEYKSGSLAEGAETIKLETYGRRVSMTRQMMVNDDLEAFRNIPAEFGQSASQLESNVVWGKLLANPTLKTDSVALFHATHNNLNTGAGSALSAAAIDAARVKMRKQTDLDGTTVLNLAPMFLLIPPELEFTAAQILASVASTKSADVTPEFIRSLTPISESRISGGVVNADQGINSAGSATQWYLASNQVDTVVYATMDGQDGPFVESQVSFDTDGMTIKCRHDFAAEAADFRGLQRSAGA